MSDTPATAVPDSVPPATPAPAPRAEPLRVLVLGAGAVGAYYGGKLAAAGALVVVVTRSEYEYVERHGYAIRSPLGDFHFNPKHVYRSASEAGAAFAQVGGYPDVVLVALKVLPEIDPVPLLRDVVGPSTAIVLIQNGIDIEGPVVAAFPGHEVLSALAFVCINRLGPGRIHHLDYGRLTLGRYPEGDSAMAARLAALWGPVGVPVDVTPDIVTGRWRKLVWNAAFNPMSVLGGSVDTRILLATPASRRLVERVMGKVCALAAADGHPLAADTAAKLIHLTARMEPYRTSMLMDYLAGRPMEVEAILGNAVRLADRLGVDVPLLAAWYGLLTLIDAQNRRAADAAITGGSHTS